MSTSLIWHKVLDNQHELAENRVMTVTADTTDICLSRYKGELTALQNKCPHQGGPLGEGSIEKGMLRCPWHGWDFCPHGGSSGDYDDGLDTFPLKIEDDAVFVGLQPAQPHEPTVTDLMAETMVNWGVNRVFGMVGHSNLGLADAFRRLEAEDKLQYIAIRHEGAASFAASAYGKLTGKPAACFAIAGPGSTNMFTGLWDAKVDRAPILALTGQVATQVVGTGNFQEVDLVRAFQTVAAFNQRVEHQSRHSELMNLAIKHAILQRDVAHITFPDQVQVLPAGTETAGSPAHRMPALQTAPAPETLQQAADALAEARRPVIVVGHGARFHMDAIIALAEELHAPVLTTFKAKGQISDAHPLGCGVLGRSGTPVASHFMNESDVLLVIGSSFSNHTGITPKKPTIQIDFDPLAIAKFHTIDIPLLGEISRSVQALQESRHSDGRALSDGKEDQQTEVARRWELWRTEKQRRLAEGRGKGISSIAVFDALWRQVPKNAIMCVDVGNNAYSLGRYFESRQHTFLMSGYLGSIGFALPASIGSWAAVGNSRQIIAVAGDGGLSQYLAEFTTLVKHDMPVKVIVLNNSELGKISKEQRAGGWPTWATGLVNPDFAAYAQSCGGLGIQINRDEEVEPALTKILAHEGPALLELKTDVKLI